MPVADLDRSAAGHGSGNPPRGRFPAERENRTIFPLAGQTRDSGASWWWEKFLGCWLACGIALVVFLRVL